MNEFQVRHWWLEGREHCGFCLQHYVYEQEYRCVHCDRAVCPDCVVVAHSHTEIFCPDCRPQDSGRI